MNLSGMHRKPAMAKEKIWKIIRYTLPGLPLAGTAVANVPPICARKPVSYPDRLTVVSGFRSF